MRARTQRSARRAATSLDPPPAASTHARPASAHSPRAPCSTPARAPATPAPPAPLRKCCRTAVPPAPTPVPDDLGTPPPPATRRRAAPHRAPPCSPKHANPAAPQSASSTPSSPQRHRRTTRRRSAINGRPWASLSRPPTPVSPPPFSPYKRGLGAALEPRIPGRHRPLPPSAAARHSRRLPNAGHRGPPFPAGL